MLYIPRKGLTPWVRVHLSGVNTYVINSTTTKNKSIPTDTPFLYGTTWAFKYKSNKTYTINQYVIIRLRYHINCNM